MKSILQVFAALVLIFCSSMTHANNWQWQLDQIKQDRQRAEKRKIADTSSVRKVAIAEGMVTCPKAMGCRCDRETKSPTPTGKK